MAPRGALVLAAVLALPACSLWSSREPLPPLPSIQATSNVAVAWRSQVGKGAEGAPAVVGGRVYAGAPDGALIALDLATGRQVWRVDTKQNLTGGVGASPGLIVVGTKKGDLLAFDEDGKPLWKSNLGTEVVSTPAAGEGAVFARTVDGRIYGVEAADGKRRWVQQRPTPVLTLRAASGAAVGRGAVYLGFPGGKLLALNSANGNPLWEANVALPRGATELERIADVSGTPALDGRRICAIAFQGRLACFDATSGNPFWTRDVPGGSGLADNGVRLFATDDKGVLVCVEKFDGGPVWRQDKLQGRHPSGVTVSGNHAWAGDEEGFVHVVDADRGELTGRIATDGSPVVGMAGVGEQGALAWTRKGGLFMLTIR